MKNFRDNLLELWEDFINYKVEHINEMTGGEYPSGTSAQWKQFVKDRITFINFMDFLTQVQPTPKRKVKGK